MNRRRIMLVLFALLLVVGGGWLMLDRPGRPQVSPDGRYSLSTSVRRDPSDRLKHLDLLPHVSDDQTGRTWTIDTNASHRMRWEAGWDSCGRIKLESADIGTRYWELIDGGGSPLWQANS